MLGLSTYLKANVIDHMLRGTGTWNPPAKLYLGLLLADPDRSGNYQEVSAPEYARQPVELEAANGDSLTQNRAPIVFPTAKESWGDVSHIAIFDAPRGGNLLMVGLNYNEQGEPEPVRVRRTNIPTWATGRLQIVL